MAHPATIEHLTRLGVTTLELLPVHAFVSEPELALRGRPNYWGYNTLTFMAPHGAYAAASDPQDAVDEFKGMVRLLHEAGIEVLLDVVYNHTCEQGVDGATLSLRGLDSRAYYRLDWQGRDVDMTGCGNTVDLRHPLGLRLALDSLRHWVQDMHVDGFRFDLATALARGRDDAYDPDHPFLMALRTDPLLSRVKLVAEPWDVGPHGWRTGQFPPPFAEWNDRYRDCVKTFWLADASRQAHGQTGHGVREVATRLAGSQDLFGARDRGPLASVNYVAAHDGFTALDAASYDRKHNEDNGEQNRDGQDDNRSWNHGVEGPTDDPEVLAARFQSVRNLLGTLLLSTGVPMLCAGDESGRTQGGNNNAYCQDNETSWLRLGPDADRSRTCWPRRPGCSSCAGGSTCCGRGSSSPAARSSRTAPPTWSGTPPTVAGWTRRPGTTPACGRCRCSSTARTPRADRCWSCCTAGTPRTSRCRSRPASRRTSCSGTARTRLRRRTARSPVHQPGQSVRLPGPSLRLYAAG